MPEITLVGIDCATQTRNVGVAVARVTDGALVLERAQAGEADFPARLTGLLNGAARALIAMDAPLGWPRALGDNLREHDAGQMLDSRPNELFRRATDRFIKAEIGQQPLDVGADRIARTAHAALSILDRLRKGTKEPVPLAWNARFSERIAAIEVYPAATLRARGIRYRGYKKARDRTARAEILEAMGREMKLCEFEPMLANADALDAAVCVLAAWDFLSGRCLAPNDAETARREGWIWCVDPLQTGVRGESAAGLGRGNPSVSNTP